MLKLCKGILLCAICLLCVAGEAQAVERFGQANLQVIKQGDRNAQAIDFQVDVASTLEQRQRGLMYRQSLPWNRGMLLDFEYDQVMNMWMKNTSIPLDMLFADSDGMIFHIVEGCEPYSLEVISSIQPGRYVLEVLAGSAARFGIKPGDVIVLPQAKRKRAD